jgi:putative membrane protein
MAMTNPSTASNADRFEVRVTADSHFAWLRTRLSVERTMMSWLRTAVSLIGFGFAIVQFFERLEQMSGAPALHPDAAKYLGLALISAGILAVLISIYQYWRMNRYLGGGPFGANRRHGSRGDAFARDRGRRAAELDRRIRVLCCAPSTRLAALRPSRTARNEPEETEMAKSGKPNILILWDDDIGW